MVRREYALFTPHTRIFRRESKKTVHPTIFALEQIRHQTYGL